MCFSSCAECEIPVILCNLRHIPSGLPFGLWQAKSTFPTHNTFSNYKNHQASHYAKSAEQRVFVTKTAMSSEGNCAIVFVPSAAAALASKLLKTLRLLRGCVGRKLLYSLSSARSSVSSCERNFLKAFSCKMMPNTSEDPASKQSLCSKVFVKTLLTSRPVSGKFWWYFWTNSRWQFEGRVALSLSHGNENIHSLTSARSCSTGKAPCSGTSLRRKGGKECQELRRKFWFCRRWIQGAVLIWYSYSYKGNQNRTAGWKRNQGTNEPLYFTPSSPDIRVLRALFSSSTIWNTESRLWTGIHVHIQSRSISLAPSAHEFFQLVLITASYFGWLQWRNTSECLFVDELGNGWVPRQRKPELSVPLDPTRRPRSWRIESSREQNEPGVPNTQVVQLRTNMSDCIFSAHLCSAENSRQFAIFRSKTVLKNFYLHWKHFAIQGMLRPLWIHAAKVEVELRHGVFLLETSSRNCYLSVHRHLNWNIP